MHSCTALVQVKSCHSASHSFLFSAGDTNPLNKPWQANRAQFCEMCSAITQVHSERQLESSKVPKILKRSLREREREKFHYVRSASLAYEDGSVFMSGPLAEWLRGNG